MVEEKGLCAFDVSKIYTHSFLLEFYLSDYILDLQFK